ncbi:MAG: hypothetical protein AB7O97_13300 [Planctomycetota bacterium]
MRIHFVVGVLFGLSLPAQSTWVVDLLNRPGTHFTDVQPAVDAAASGDRIEIRSIGVPPPLVGYYSAPLIDGKGVTIVGEGAEGPSTTWWYGDISIRNLPMGQRVHVVDIQLGLWAPVRPIAGGLFDLRNNDGEVVFERIVARTGSTGPSIWVDTRLLLVKQSVLWVLGPRDPVRSSLISVDTDWRNSFAGPVIDAVDSKVWLINSTVIGLDVNHLGNSGSALRTRNSEVWVGPGTLLQGGITAAGPREAIDDVNTSLVHFDPRSTVIGYVGSLRANDPVPAIRTSIQGNVLSVDHRCTPSSVALLAFGGLLPQPSFSGAGLLCVDPASCVAFFAAVPASGDLLWQFAIPPGLPPELFVGLQGVELRADGAVQLTNPTTFGGV